MIDILSRVLLGIYIAFAAFLFFLGCFGLALALRFQILNRRRSTGNVLVPSRLVLGIDADSVCYRNLFAGVPVESVAWITEMKNGIRNQVCFFSYPFFSLSGG